MRESASQLLNLARYDLLQRRRDKSVVIFAILVPLTLITVFNLVFGGTEEMELRPITVVAAIPDDDQLAATLVEVLETADLGDFEITLTRADEDAAREQVRAADADLGLLVPDGFTAAVQAGQGPVVEAVQGDGREIESQIVLSIVDGMLQQFAAASEAAVAALGAGIGVDELEQVAQDAVSEGPAYTIARGEASNEQLDTAGTLVAGQSGLFLFFTVGFGVVGLIVERENGTLARLRSMPMRPNLVVVAKALVSFGMGVVATAILLGAGALLFDTDFGSLPAVTLLVLCASAAATSLTFVIVRVARTSEQASVIQSIVSLLLGIAGGAFVPLQASGWLGTLLDVNPVAALIRGLGITAGGGGIADLGDPIAILLGFGLLSLLLARLLPNRGVVS